MQLKAIRMMTVPVGLIRSVSRLLRSPSRMSRGAWG
ncbi:hypothetical protein GZL_03038 [Streptomyces sp. 769]|nr:hypothetical protein GZL_03038 [Streptomyces sp. 769]